MNLLEIRNQIAFAVSSIEVGEVDKSVELLDKLVVWFDKRFSCAEMGNINYDTEEEKEKRFRDHLKRCSAEVKTWPKWKRELLGKHNEY